LIESHMYFSLGILFPFFLLPLVLPSPPSTPQFGKETKMYVFLLFLFSTCSEYHNWLNANVAVSGYYLEAMRINCEIILFWCSCQCQLLKCQMAHELFTIKSFADHIFCFCKECYN
jgi:hypothetical protein